VDLPGLINIPTEQQDEADVTVVRQMVLEYMSNPRSIILAIVSAASDMSEHTILNLVKEVDPAGKRTLGIITKPDMLPEGSNSERQFLTLASNENNRWHLDLGWHVVRNRHYNERHVDLDERDRIEQEWFEQSIWANTLGFSSIGIQFLRQRLAALLESHTRQYLPQVIEEKTLLNTCETELARLGPARETPEKQRRYLIETSREFTRLVHAATEGIYRHNFFDVELQQHRRIRARVQVLNRSFAQVMHSRGHGLAAFVVPAHESAPIPTSYLSAAGNAPIVNLPGYLHAIRRIMDNFSGQELPGLFNPHVIGQVFNKKAQKWNAIASAHINEVWMVVKDAMVAMVNHCTNGDTSKRILRHVVFEVLEKRRIQMDRKLAELLAPNMKSQPMTYDPHFEEDVRKIYVSVDPRNDAGSRNAQETWTEAHALCYVEAYYKASLKHVFRCRY
jgi:hemerythrin superfamily protein